MGGRGGSPRTNLNTVIAQAAAKAPAPEAPAAPQPLQTRIDSLLRQLETHPYDLVSLVKLRGNMSDVDRATLDAELKRLDRARIIQLDPDPNTKAIPQEGKDAAIKIGPEMKHFISRVR